MIRRQIYSIILFLHAVTGLEVAPNSPCAKKCLDDPTHGNPSWSNASLTFGPDFPCMDQDYIGSNATKVGKKFADCQTCMQSSGWSDEEGGERDTQWFLCAYSPQISLPRSHILTISLRSQQPRSSRLLSLRPFRRGKQRQHLRHAALPTVLLSLQPHLHSLGLPRQKRPRELQLLRHKRELHGRRTELHHVSLRQQRPDYSGQQ